MFDVPLRAGVSTSMLLPFAILLTALLAYAVYTDLFRGHVILNQTSMAIFVLCIAVLPFLVDDPLEHAAWGLIPVVISLVMVMVGGQGGGDFKLYAGLCPLFGPAGFAFFLISSVIVLIYSIPSALVHAKANRGKQLPFGHRLGAQPAGPGIALAVPVTLALMGYSLLFCLGMAAVGALLVLLYHKFPEYHEPEPTVWPQANLDSE